MNKHSQGTWHILMPQTKGSSLSILNKDDWYENAHWIASVNQQFNGYENAIANAKLIAAAPELLENLARIIDRIEESNMQDNFPSDYKRAKEAINKATL